MKLPLIFCVAAPEEGAVAVFETRLLRPRVYSISSYRIFHGILEEGGAEPATAYSADSGQPSDLSDESITLISPSPYDGTNQSVDEIRWKYSGKTIYSMYCGTGIPLLEFELPQGLDGVFTDWFGAHDDVRHHLPVIAATPEKRRIWTRRWNPMYWRIDYRSPQAVV